MCGVLPAQVDLECKVYLRPVNMDPTSDRWAAVFPPLKPEPGQVERLSTGRTCFTVSYFRLYPIVFIITSQEDQKGLAPLWSPRGHLLFQ